MLIQVVPNLRAERSDRRSRPSATVAWAMHSRLRRSLARLLPVEIIHWRARRKSSLSDKSRVLVETMLLNLLYPHDFGFTFQRFGSPYDGGYVLPREIAIHAGIGIGIRDNWDFERDLEMQLGIHVVKIGRAHV